MTECDRPAIGAYTSIILDDVKLVEHGENLGGEGLGDLDAVEFIDTDTGLCAYLSHGRDRAEAGPSRIDAGSGAPQDR